MTTRFAPSPTGYLHIGGLRTALYSYLHSRHHSGKFLLRIEDTDLKRNSIEATKAILEAFKWCGLSYEGEIEYQSQRFDIYKVYIDKLLQSGKAYKCYMSKEELEALRKEQTKRKERPKYDNRYRNFTGTPPSGIEPVIRIKAPDSGVIEFNDGIKGHIKFNAEDILDDFVIARADGSPTYNFVVTIDDALMGVTDVIRGDDHLSNTPKQIILYEALGFKVPNFFHVPMINGEDGKKLSKRHGATDVMDYKNQGFLPEALLNFLVRLGWSHGDDELFSLDEMIKYFDANDVNSSASTYNYEKLLWINSQYIKKLSSAQIKNLLQDLSIDKIECQNEELLFEVVKDRAKTMVEFANEIRLILNEVQEYDEKVCEKCKNNLPILKDFLEKIKSCDAKSKEDFENIAKDFLEKNGLKSGSLAQILRLSLLGKMGGAGVYEVMSILGLKTSIKRIEKFIQKEQ